MVARPPVKLLIEPMRLEDLEAVQRIEHASFSSPWPPNAYRSELEDEPARVATSSPGSTARSSATAGCG